MTREARRMQRGLIRIVSAAGVALLAAGALGLSAGSAEAAGRQPLAAPIVLADSVPSPSCPTVTETATETVTVTETVTTTLFPAVNAATTTSCSPCPTDWPTVTQTVTQTDTATVTVSATLYALQGTDLCAASTSTSTKNVAPTAVNAGLAGGSSGSGWPGLAMVVGLVLLALAGVLFSALGERGRREA